jgi:hypothetical protein
MAISERPEAPGGLPDVVVGLAIPTSGKRSTLWIVVVFFGIGFQAAPCYAYIDPNAGGWLSQILFPVLVAIGAAWAYGKATLQRLWHSVHQRLRRALGLASTDE